MDLLCSWFFIKIITIILCSGTPPPPPKKKNPSSIFCYSPRTLKFSSDHIRAVNPEGPLVPWTMLSSLHPKHRWDLKTLGATLLLSARASCHKQFPPQDDAKIKSLLVFAEPFHECPRHTSLTIHPFVEQQNHHHRRPLCGESARLQMRFSGICSVNDIWGLCLTGRHIVRLWMCSAWVLWSRRALPASPLSLWLINQIFIHSP